MSLPHKRWSPEVHQSQTVLLKTYQLQFFSCPVNVCPYLALTSFIRWPHTAKAEDPNTVHKIGKRAWRWQAAQYHHCGAHQGSSRCPWRSDGKVKSHPRYTPAMAFSLSWGSNLEQVRFGRAILSKTKFLQSMETKINPVPASLRFIWHWSDTTWHIRH